MTLAAPPLSFVPLPSLTCTAAHSDIAASNPVCSTGGHQLKEVPEQGQHRDVGNDETNQHLERREE